MKAVSSSVRRDLTLIPSESRRPPTRETLISYLASRAVGRDNAVKSQSIKEHFGCRGRTIRRLIPIIEDHYGVVVLSRHDLGYYIPKDKRELLAELSEERARLRSEIHQHNKRARLFGLDDI